MPPALTRDDLYRLDVRPPPGSALDGWPLRKPIPTHVWSGALDPSDATTVVEHLGGHLAVAEWSIWCAAEVLPLWEAAHPRDNRPARALQLTRQLLARPRDAQTFVRVAHAARAAHEASREAETAEASYAALSVHSAAGYVVRVLTTLYDLPFGADDGLVFELLNDAVPAHKAAHDAEAAGVMHCTTASLLRVCERHKVVPTSP